MLRFECWLRRYGDWNLSIKACYMCVNDLARKNLANSKISNILFPDEIPKKELCPVFDAFCCYTERVGQFCFCNTKIWNFLKQKKKTSLGFVVFFFLRFYCASKHMLECFELLVYNVYPIAMSQSIEPFVIQCSELMNCVCVCVCVWAIPKKGPLVSFSRLPFLMTPQISRVKKMFMFKLFDLFSSILLHQLLLR